MALVKCSECGAEISDKAAACIKCGAPLGPHVAHRTLALTPSQPRSLFWTTLVILGGAAAVWLFTETPKKSDQDASAAIASVTPPPAAALPAQPAAPAQDATPPIEITAQQLMQEYHANEVAADMKFKGKRLKVTGDVVEISKNIMDEPYITLATGQDFSNVHASFGKGGEQALAVVKKGDSVTINCAGNGMTLQSPMLKCGS